MNQDSKHGKVNYKLIIWSAVFLAVVLAVWAADPLYVIGNANITGNITSGTGTVFIDGTNSRIGIGTKSPLSMLHLYKTGTTPTEMLRLGDTTDYAYFNLSGTGIMYVGGIASSGCGGYFCPAVHFKDPVLFNNKVGIGTTLPNEMLTVVGNINVTGNITSGQGTVFIDGTNSRVGIGTASPNVQLHLKASPNTILKMDGDSTGNPYIEWAQAGTSKAYIQYVDSGDTLRGVVNGNVGWYIDTSGRVGIGDSTPDRALDVEDSGIAIEGYSTGNYGIYGHSAAANSRGIYAYAHGTGTTYGLYAQVTSSTGYSGYFIGGVVKMPSFSSPPLTCNSASAGSIYFDSNIGAGHGRHCGCNYRNSAWAWRLLDDPTAICT